jgi:hypothetical protein
MLWNKKQIIDYECDEIIVVLCMLSDKDPPHFENSEKNLSITFLLEAAASGTIQAHIGLISIFS